MRTFIFFILILYLRIVIDPSLDFTHQFFEFLLLWVFAAHEWLYFSDPFADEFR